MPFMIPSLAYAPSIIRMGPTAFYWSLICAGRGEGMNMGIHLSVPQQVILSFSHGSMKIYGILSSQAGHKKHIQIWDFPYLGTRDIGQSYTFSPIPIFIHSSSQEKFTHFQLNVRYSQHLRFNCEHPIESTYLSSWNLKVRSKLQHYIYSRVRKLQFAHIIYQIISQPQK